MLRGLFINNPKAKDSIHESGMMVYKCLQLSQQFAIDYIEVNAAEREIKKGYDFYFFNYHPHTMAWLDTRPLQKELGTVITMILEVSPGDAFIMCPKNDFSFYCALDPTIKSKGKLYAFPRPLESINFKLPVVKNEIPVIGSFGFSTKGKGFELVVEAVNKEFDRARVRINIPFGDFVPDSESYSAYLSELCKGKAKPGIDVEVTHDFMSKEDLIKWCANNDLNCFLYDRNMPGLAATTDQAIITGKPLAVSGNDTFRHITAYLTPYPKWSLKASLNNSAAAVEQMKTDWSPENFTKRFDRLLTDNNIVPQSEKGEGHYLLPLYTKPPNYALARRLKKYKGKIKKLFS